MKMTIEEFAKLCQLDICLTKIPDHEDWWARLQLRDGRSLMIADSERYTNLCAQGSTMEGALQALKHEIAGKKLGTIGERITCEAPPISEFITF